MVARYAERMTTTPPNISKKPWYKKVWIWVIVGAVIVIGGISNLVNGVDDDVTPVATTPTTIATPDDTASEEPEPSEEAEPAGPSDEERAATFEAALREAFGGQEPSEVLVSDPSLWYGWVNGVRVENDYVYVTLQLGGPQDAEWTDFGERAAQALSTLIPASAVDGISWIIVEDASGVVIDQKQPQPLS